MPVYEVQGPDRRTFEVDAPQPPTMAQLQPYFAKMGQPEQAAPPPQAPSAAPASGGLRASMRERALSRLGLPADASVEDALGAVDRSERERTAAGARVVPMVTGAVGGIMGGPLGAVGGGIVGKAIEQTVLRGQGDPSVPTEPVDQAIAMGKEGAIQGVAQGAGQALAYGGGRLAKWLMNRATTRVTARLMRDFPELSDTLIDNALTVSKGGHAKAVTLLKNAKVKANAALGRAEAAGKLVPVQFTDDLAESFKTGLIEQAVKSGKTPLAPGQPLTQATARLPRPVQDLIAKVEQATAQGQPFDLTPTQADLLKTQLQKESRALYANRTAPDGQRAMQAAATVKAEFASRLNDALDLIASGYRAANAEAKPLIGAVRGLQQAIRPNGNLYQAMVRPAVGAVLGGAAGSREGGMGATTGALAGAIAGTPKFMSGSAIVLRHPVVQQLAKQLPRGLWEAIEAHVLGEASQTTNRPTQER